MSVKAHAMSCSITASAVEPSSVITADVPEQFSVHAGGGGGGSLLPGTLTSPAKMEVDIKDTQRASGRIRFIVFNLSEVSDC